MDQIQWNLPTILVVVFAALAIIDQIAERQLRKKYINQMFDQLMSGDYEGFDQTAARKIVRWVVPPYNLEKARLSSYQLRGDAKAVDELMRGFRSRRLNKAQKEDIYPQAFDYFMGEGNYEEAKFYLDGILQFKGHDEMKQAFSREYRILAEHKTDDLDGLLKETDGMKPEYRGGNEFLISEIYRQLGDEGKAEEYLSRSKKHMEQYTELMAKQMKSSAGSAPETKQ
jgi:hypothetical protein